MGPRQDQNVAGQTLNPIAPHLTSGASGMM
jgi:hypothetical protein